MQKSEICPGTEYALRERRVRGEPFQHVRILQHVRGSKWKAEWIEPNAGLVHYVDSGSLVVPWKERKAFLKEEADEQRLREHNGALGYDDGSPLSRALEQVFECVGDDVLFYRENLSGSPASIERLRSRAGVPLDKKSPWEYADRLGRLHLPVDDALAIAKGLCAKEPATVLVSIESTEHEWSRDVQRGADHLVGLLNEYRASWALIRQWTGHDPAVAQREAEIQRLERLVWDAIYALQKAGADREASRLRRAIQRE
jgi:hypothetical protein